MIPNLLEYWSEKSKISPVGTKGYSPFSMICPILQFCHFLNNCLRLSQKLKYISPLCYFNTCILSLFFNQHNDVNRCHILELQTIRSCMPTISVCFLHTTLYGQPYFTLNTFLFDFKHLMLGQIILWFIQVLQIYNLMIVLKLINILELIAF